MEFGVGCLGLTLVRGSFIYGNNSKVRGFRDLTVSQESLSKDSLTLSDPIAKDFRYKDQIRGSCGSIMDNIAEGFGRGSKLEFINSLTIAKSGAEELKSQLYRGLDNQYFSAGLFEELYGHANFWSKKLAHYQLLE